MAKLDGYQLGNGPKHWLNFKKDLHHSRSPTRNTFSESDIMESGLLNANESLRPKSHLAAPD